MSVPQEDIVQPIIDNYRQPIVAAVLGAWDDWRKSPYCGVWRCKRSRANFVWEQIIERAHLAFDKLPNVHIIEGHETFNFLLDGQVLFRFKKGDESGLSTNVPTRLALAFHDHDQNMLGLPHIQRIEVVYQLNGLETAIFDVRVVGRDGDVVAWSYSLLASAAVVVPLPVPASRVGTPTVPVRRLVRPRHASQMPNQGKRN